MANRRRAHLRNLLLALVGLGGVTLLQPSCSDLALPPDCSEAAEGEYCFVADAGADAPPVGATPDAAAPEDVPTDLTSDAPADAPSDLTGDAPADLPSDARADLAADLPANMTQS